MHGRLIDLTAGDVTATVATVGAALRALAVDGVPVIAPIEDAHTARDYHGHVLAPWPNRLADGAWERNGETYQSPVNEPATGCALHGLVAFTPWQVVHHDEAEVRLRHVLGTDPGYPFRVSLDARFSLGADGLAVRLTAKNDDEVSVPFGFGVHPYFDAPDGVDRLSLALPAATRLTSDARMLPVDSQALPADDPALGARPLGTLQLDDAFTDLARDQTGRTWVELRGNRRPVSIWAGPTCSHLMVFTADTLPEGRRRNRIAIEPMTCPPNALATGQADLLAPGEEFHLDWGVTVGEAE